VLMGTGTAFQDATKPTPVIQVGKAGDVGSVEITDMWFSTRGPAAGAIVVEWNVKESTQGSASMHASHVVLGGYTGSECVSPDCQGLCLILPSTALLAIPAHRMPPLFWTAAGAHSWAST
jgi:hypothetical protein